MGEGKKRDRADLRGKKVEQKGRGTTAALIAEIRK